MTESSPLLDPEVEAILREVAQDPDSVLLRVDRPKELRVLVAGGDTIVRGKTGLSKAEKQLLEVHRDEAAYLLRLAYYELADRAAKEGNRGLFDYRSEKHDTPLTDSQMCSQLRYAQGCLSADKEADQAIGLGLTILASPGDQLVNLAVCSLRLAPSVSARCYIGSEHIVKGYLRSARLAYEGLIREPMRASQKAHCLMYLADVLFLTGQPAESRERIRGAVDESVSEDRVLSWLSTSIQTGHTAQAQEALRLLNENWPTPTSVTRAWLSVVERQRDMGLWTFSHSRASLVEALMDRASDTAKHVLRTLTGGE